MMLMERVEAMSAQTIFRVAYRHAAYSQLGNAMLQDERMSPEATHILVFVLSLPIDWRFNLPWIAKRRKLGRDRAQRAIRELQQLGYCRREQTRDSDGKMGAYEYVFTDDPQHLASPEPENPVPVIFTETWKPVTGKPAPVNQAPNKENTSLQKRKSQTRSRAKGPNSDLKSGEGAPITIYRNGPEWQRWLDFLDQCDRPLANRMRGEFMANVPARFPSNTAMRPKFPAKAPAKRVKVAA